MYRKPNKRHYKRVKYKGTTFKSSYEAQVAKYLDELGVKWEYEPEKYPYTLPVCYYEPDFKITWNDGTVEYMEAKGFFEPQDRTKMKVIREQYPDMNITMHFQKEYNRLSPSSPTTYLEWAEKHGFPVRFFNEFGTWLSTEEENNDGKDL